MSDNSRKGFYLCVDCGGSKTAVVVANSSGSIVGRSYGGPSNFAYLGLSNFVRTVKDSVERALNSIEELSPGEQITLPSSTPLFAAAWFGISGCDSPANVALLTPVLSQLLSLPGPAPSPRLSICNDAHLLAAPLSFHPDVQFAVTAIAGTGSIVTTFKRGHGGEGQRDPIQELVRTGGYGWILGDEGGGFDVGREAIRQVVQTADLAPLRTNSSNDKILDDGKKSLVTRIIEHFDVSSPYEILTLVHDPDPPSDGKETGAGDPPHTLIPREKRLSQLAPLVFTSAFEDNDPLAIKILRTTSSSLASQIASLLQPPHGPEHPFAARANDGVICFGGSLVGIEQYRNFILEDLAKRGHDFKYVEYIDDAAASGAASLASRFTS